MRRRQIAGSDSPACAVLVLSCDRYQDLWAPFFRLFQRYWYGCTMPVYLGTQLKRADLEWVHTLCAGDDEAWSRRLRFFLERLDYEYVLLMLEDFFLDRPISDAEVNHQLHLLHSLDGMMIRLFTNPPADYFRDAVGVVHTRAYFRVSLQAAIWNRSYLLSLLVDEESPWEFEIKGTRRSRAHASGFYCVPQSVIHYRHVVELGQWFRGAAHFYGPQNIGCNLQVRSTMGVLQTWKKAVANYLRRLNNRMHSYWLCIRYPERVSDGA